MKRWKMVLASAVATIVTLPALLSGQQARSSMVYSPGELEQLAAPIALYPDPLLAQVLMASAYPLEIVQAARFVRANPTLKDGWLNEALRAQDWDDSVKALAQFPQILDMMDGQLEWTQRLGDVFLAQRAALMDAVQSLRARALAQGLLISSPQQIVRVQAPVIYIEPARPQVIYVPVYNPLIVYGPWPYPARQPYYYRPVGWPAGKGVYSFGGGIVVASGLWGAFDWHRRAVFVDAPRYRRYTEIVNVPGRRGGIERSMVGPHVVVNRMVWQPDVRRRESAWAVRPVPQPPVAPLKPAIAPPREPPRGRAEQPRAEQLRAERSQTSQPRVEQGRPQPGRGGQEAVRQGSQPGGQAAPRPESDRPKPANSPRMMAHVQATSAPESTPRRDPGERGRETRGGVAPRQ